MRKCAFWQWEEKSVRKKRLNQSIFKAPNAFFWNLACGITKVSTRCTRDSNAVKWLFSLWFQVYAWNGKPIHMKLVPSVWEYQVLFTSESIDAIWIQVVNLERVLESVVSCAHVQSNLFVLVFGDFWACREIFEFGIPENKSGLIRTPE